MAALIPARGQDLLLTGTPCEVLARIVPEDPLGLTSLVSARLEERALLLEMERVVLRAQVLCALHAPGWRGDPELGPWLEERVEEALESLLAEDDAGDGEPSSPHAWTRLASLGLDGRALGAACAQFNGLSAEARQAFFVLVLRAQAPDRAARSRGLSLTDLARRARSALELFRPAHSAADRCTPDGNPGAHGLASVGAAPPAERGRDARPWLGRERPSRRPA